VALTKIGFTLIKDNFKDSVSGSSTEHSSSFSTRVTDLGLYLSGSGTLISGSAISTGSFGAANIAGMSVSNLVDFSSSIASRVTDEESDFTAAGISGSWQGVIGSGSLGMVSGSAISTGSFGRVIISEMGNSDLTDVSASISTRVNLLEGSGSITESSASFSTRVNLLEGSGSITESSASFSTRVNLLEGSGSINDLVTASGSFSTRVSDLKTDSGSFSTRVTTAEASGALFDGDGVVTFAGATITGTLTAQEVHTEFISASVTVSTGSNIFGDETGDVHQFTGSIETSGSIILDTLGGNVSGSIVSTGSFGAANIAGMTVSNLVDVSSSISTRVSDLVTDSGSFSTRVSDLNLSLSGSTTLISGSATSTGSFGQLNLVAFNAGFGATSNIYLGTNAGSGSTSGTDNVAIGTNAGDALTGGSGNTILGKDALTTNLTGGDNVAIGKKSLKLNTNSYNTAVGKDALENNVATKNTAIGYQAGHEITSGATNVIVGAGALDAATTVLSSVAIGVDAMGAVPADQAVEGATAVGYEAFKGTASTTDGANGTVAIGYAAGAAITTGGGNTLVGYSAGDALNTGNLNTTLGRHSLGAATTASGSVAIGYQTGNTISTGNQNIAIGFDAMQGGTVTGDNNIAIGTSAGDALTSATNDVLIGKAAGGALNVGGDNIAIGENALSSATNTGGVVAIGHEAGASINSNDANLSVLIGFNAGDAITDGSLNVGIGYNALGSNVSGDKNVAIGYQAGEDYNPTANFGNCVFVGHQAGLNVSTARKATIIGNAAVGLGVMTGHENTVIGNEAGYDLTGGTSNVIIGDEAGANLTTGKDNVIIGQSAGDATTDTSGSVIIGMAAGGTMAAGANANTFIGYNAGANDGTMTGDANVVIGYNTAKTLTTATDNTIVGKAAGLTLTTGNYCSIVGASSNVNATGAQSRMILGFGVSNPTDNSVRIGSGGNFISNTFTSNATWAHSSDGRLKENIEDDSLGLSFINDLRTVTYNWKKQKDIPENLKNESGFEKDTENKQHGMIAQEVKKALDKHNIDSFLGWSEDEGNSQQMISEDMFVFPLIKAVQELSEQNKVLEKRIKELEN